MFDTERQPIYKFNNFLKKEFISIKVDIEQANHKNTECRDLKELKMSFLNRRQSKARVETLKALVNVKNDLRP